ncbi:GNAT family N-acetyltransferase [Maridesulfovibrio sp.]|uniref:GNAT family N-acetyltransferase n=1 Tax=Maridesulfovibrio sp. TaxID=2795000 RepID=UPI002A18E424|nr:GNAT family N-acetyltransferase [Maridesulfovibrio sp.]
MELEIVYDCKNVDWNDVVEMLKSVGMAFHSPEKHRRAFEASHTTVFIYSEKQLVGFGRAISDGEYQAAVYDCAVSSACQGQGIGSLIMREILKQLPDCNVILYAAPGKEGFYQKHEFRKMKTGMALFVDQMAAINKGFTE